jgi:hypothetical protein
VKTWVLDVMGDLPEREDELRELSDKAVCPNCGSTITAGKRHVYGRGVFCGLDCVAEYNAAELIERHRRIIAALERHKRS